MSFKAGDVGENWVQLWASQAKITANPVRRDECGWDFCLQIRRENAPEKAVPLDELPPELTAMVQVKTTVAGSSSEAIALSNWHRMVKDPLPWFVVRVVLSNEGEAEKVFVVHVGPAWIEKVLKRLRELDAEGVTELNKHDLHVTWSDEVVLAHPIAPALRARILETVGNVDEYVRQKAVVRETVGYDEGRYTVKFERPTPKSDEDIEREVDFAIGLIDKLPISAFSVRETRFSVPRLVKDKRDLEGFVELSARPSSGTTRLRFSNASKSESIILAFETHLPFFFLPNLPKEHLKAKFVSPIAEVIIEPRREAMRVSWNLPGVDAPAPLARIASVGRLIGLFSRAAATGGVTISYESAEGERDIARGGVMTFSAEVRRVAELAQHAEFLARYFGLESDVSIRLEDLDDQYEQLTALRGILDRGTGGYAIKVHVRGGRQANTQRWALMLPMSARVDDHVLAASIAILGEPEWEEDDWMTISQGEVRVLSKAIVPIGGWKAFDHVARSSALKSELPDDVTAVDASPGVDDV